MSPRDFISYAVHCGETVLYSETEDTWYYWKDICEYLNASEAEMILRLPRSFEFKEHPLYGVSSYEEEAMIVLRGLGD